MLQELQATFLHFEGIKAATSKAIKDTHTSQNAMYVINDLVHTCRHSRYDHISKGGLDNTRCCAFGAANITYDSFAAAALEPQPRPGHACAWQGVHIVQPQKLQGGIDTIVRAAGPILP